MHSLSCHHPVISLGWPGRDSGEDFHARRLAAMVELTPHMVYDANHSPLDALGVAHMIRLALAAREWWGSRFLGLLVLRLPEVSYRLVEAVVHDGLLVVVPETKPCLHAVGSRAARILPCRLASDWIFEGCADAAESLAVAASGHAGLEAAFADRT